MDTRLVSNSQIRQIALPDTPAALRNAELLVLFPQKRLKRVKFIKPLRLPKLYMRLKSQNPALATSWVAQPKS